ncbi:hypothetical protein N7451_005559 [Penicillium sp. IBT 35674x]|nr:hypothetical protein N7451_005559 [Penicillium sp. IBT 35674x]
MAPPRACEEYADLMSGHEGYYLLVPHSYDKIHPGVVGYFDKNGLWHTITDVSEKGRPERDSLSSFDTELKLALTDSAQWNYRTSGKDAETSFGLSAGLTGALASAPIDVSAEAKNKSSSSGKAALITEELVKTDRFESSVRKPMRLWLQENVQTLVDSNHEDDIRDYGVWAIHTTWSTPECAIIMQSAHTRDTSAGVDLGATGVAKAGASGSSLSKLQAKNWSTYSAEQGKEKGLVVAIGGTQFKMKRKLLSLSGKQTFQVVMNKSLPVGTEKREPEGETPDIQTASDDEEEEEFEFACERDVGMTEDDRKEEENERQELRERLTAIVSDTSLDINQKKAEIKKLMDENKGGLPVVQSYNVSVPQGSGDE